MKYIKQYQIFESNELDMKSVKEDINDIFLDIRDIGFITEFNINAVDVSAIKNKPSYRFEFRLERVDLKNSSVNDQSPNTVDFDSSLIKEDINRLCDYLKSLIPKEEEEKIGIHSVPSSITYSLFTMPTRWEDIDQFIHLDSNNEIYVFRLDGWIHI